MLSKNLSKLFQLDNFLGVAMFQVHLPRTGNTSNTSKNTNNTVKFRESAATGIYIMKIKGSDNSVFTAKIIKK